MKDNLRKKIMRVLIPNLEQLKPDAFEITANGRKLEGIMAVVEKHIAERLADAVMVNEQPRYNHNEVYKLYKKVMKE